jgi:hypothetical protein
MDGRQLRRLARLRRIESTGRRMLHTENPIALSRRHRVHDTLVLAHEDTADATHPVVPVPFCRHALPIVAPREPTYQQASTSTNNGYGAAQRAKRKRVSSHDNRSRCTGGRMRPPAGRCMHRPEGPTHVWAPGRAACGPALAKSTGRLSQLAGWATGGEPASTPAPCSAGWPGCSGTSPLEPSRPMPAAIFDPSSESTLRQ